MALRFHWFLTLGYSKSVWQQGAEWNAAIWGRRPKKVEIGAASSFELLSNLQEWSIQERWYWRAGYVARIGENRIAYKVCSEYFAEIGYVEEWMVG